jgi:hypothetical protein
MLTVSESFGKLEEKGIMRCRTIMVWTDREICYMNLLCCRWDDWEGDGFRLASRVACNDSCRKDWWRLRRTDSQKPWVLWRGLRRYSELPAAEQTICQEGLSHKCGQVNSVHSYNAWAVLCFSSGTTALASRPWDRRTLPPSLGLCDLARCSLRGGIIWSDYAAWGTEAEPVASQSFHL